MRFYVDLIADPHFTYNRLNRHSDELKKHFLEPKLSLDKNYRVSSGLVLGIIIHGFQLTYS